MHKNYINISIVCMSNPLTRMSSFSFHLENALLLNAKSLLEVITILISDFLGCSQQRLELA